MDEPECGPATSESVRKFDDKLPSIRHSTPSPACLRRLPSIPAILNGTTTAYGSSIEPQILSPLEPEGKSWKWHEEQGKHERQEHGKQLERKERQRGAQYKENGRHGQEEQLAQREPHVLQEYGMQDEQDKQGPSLNAVSHNHSSTPELLFLDGEAMQMVFERLVKGRWVNDDCINVLLEAFNPDPALWYIAPTQLTSRNTHEGSIYSKFRDVTTIPRKLMFPVYLPNHWTLVALDRQTKECIVYDPAGHVYNCVEAWGKVQKFLRQQNVFLSNVKVDMEPFLKLHQRDSTNCGIYVVATAIHVLHGQPPRRVTPGLWREVLARFFSTSDDLQYSWLREHLARPEIPWESILEKMTEALNSLSADIIHIEACEEETLLLLTMADKQLKVLAERACQRRREAKLHKWLSTMPSGAAQSMHVVLKQRTSDTVSQLKSLPKELQGSLQQMQKLIDACGRMREDIATTISDLNQRRVSLFEEILVVHADISRRLKALKKSGS